MMYIVLYCIYPFL